MGCVCPVYPGRRVPPAQDRVEARGGRPDEDAGGGPHQPPDADQQGGQDGQSRIHQDVLQKYHQESRRICDQLLLV